MLPAASGAAAVESAARGGSKTAPVSTREPTAPMAGGWGKTTAMAERNRPGHRAAALGRAGLEGSAVAA